VLPFGSSNPVDSSITRTQMESNIKIHANSILVVNLKVNTIAVSLGIE
jgi:hypothetical protein